MLKPVATKQFKKDFKKVGRQGKDVKQDRILILIRVAINCDFIMDRHGIPFAAPVWLGRSVYYASL
jgi:hypothetical protein